MTKITYGIHKSSFGEIVLGMTEKGLCWLGFMVSKADGAYKGDGLARMKAFFPSDAFKQDDAATRPMFERVMQAWESDDLKSIPLDLQGTPFQISVWQALLDIPGGETRSYNSIAEAIDKPQASRAVGGAVGSNPVSLIVPCHRVVQSSGKIGNYGWGVDLKKKLLEAENVAHRKQAA